MAMGEVGHLTDKERALEAILLFYEAGPWDDRKARRWHALTGQREVTTKVLCDLARTVLGKPGMRD